MRSDRNALLAVLITLVACLVAIAYGRLTVENPDPNHTHADFAVWVNGKKMDFSGEYFMSGSSDAPNAKNLLRQYLHLHDGNGHVAHRHKEGLTFGQFLGSLGFENKTSGDRGCLAFDGETFCDAGSEFWTFRYQHSGGQVATEDKGLDEALQFIFGDGDKLLLSFGDMGGPIDEEWKQMTDDACLYSQMCPWRGKPPTENCIADPMVPCVGK